MELFLIYLRLGCIAFGGPVAHLGYFKESFVTRRQWLSEARFAELLGLCQFVPGPSSSQLGFAIGWHRAGLSGACLAWLGFTLPSALIMLSFAYGLFLLGDHTARITDGLLIAAVAVVANALLGLGKKLTPDLQRVGIAAFSAVAAYTMPSQYFQAAVIAIGALAGYMLYSKQINQIKQAPSDRRKLTKSALPALALFTTLLVATFWIQPKTFWALPALHYQAGALVFGGGHVVLPLLHESVVVGGHLTEANFLAGYSAAQTVPGPLFTFAAFTGTVGSGFSPYWLEGIATLIAIFLPGMLLLVGLLPFWDRIRSRTWAKAGLLGANASVVGLLAAAFIDPVLTHGIHNWIDAAIALAAFAALNRFKLPPWLVVISCGFVGWLI